MSPPYPRRGLNNPVILGLPEKMTHLSIRLFNFALTYREETYITLRRRYAVNIDLNSNRALNEANTQD